MSHYSSIMKDQTLSSGLGDGIANVNCFTTTSDTYYTKYSRLAPKLWHTDTVFTKDWKHQETITTMELGIAIPDLFSNPGISGLKNANPGIPGLNPGIESLILN